MAPGKRLIISDIQTTELLYYDPGLKEQCYKFCAQRDIDCLPALDDPQKIYMRNDAGKNFKESPVTVDRIVSGEVNIFIPAMLERFRQQPLLMVYHGENLTGVVHFCDYNKPVVSIYIYDSFLEYEKTLRSLLIKSGLNNEDMLAYFEEKMLKEPDHYKEKIRVYRERDSKKKLQQFEVFYLSDLIALINHKKLIKLGDVGKLRNLVMHANEFVLMQDPTTDDLLYDFNTFEDFFGLVLLLHSDLKRVSNRLEFIPLT